MIDWQALTDVELIAAYEKALAEHGDEAQEATVAKMQRVDLDY